ncbi:hypothetical protein ScPMuIL_016727 [Solemya velum]
MRLLSIRLWLALCLHLSVWMTGVRAEVLQMVESNVNDLLSNNELVFVNFYADWCRFSQILAPVFDETATKIKEEFPGYGHIAFARVDCDSQNEIASKYHISKYPTLKLFRNGNVLKKEYRGQRSVDALSDYLREQMKNPIIQHQVLEDLEELEPKKRHVIAYLISEDSEVYKTYKRVASALRNECEFHTALGPVSEPERTTGENIVYRPPNTHRQDVVFSGPMDNYDYMYQWMHDKCIPLVREITFENAEELTEEGLPFMILFHKADDEEIKELYTREVQNQVLGEQNSMNFLTADGMKFTHPLHHLGKTPADLPVLCIDSFRHMYVFPHSVKEGLQTPGLLKQFVLDLHSGKLHREFHHGPDPTTTSAPQLEDGGEDKTEQHIPHDPSEKPKQPTSPPESTFNKLKPSRNRYTLLRDEL